MLTKMKLGRSRPYINPTPVPKMPSGLVELMEGLSREVIKNNPSDIFNFCADHMSKLLELRDGRPPKKCMNLEQKINVANNIIKQRAEQRRVNYDKNMEMCIRQNNLTDVKSHGKSTAETEYHHVDKSSGATQANIMQIVENIKIEDSELDNNEINSSKIEFSDEKLKENEVSQTAVERCDVNITGITLKDNTEGADSVKNLSNKANINILPDNNKNMGDLNTADVNHPKDDKVVLSKQEDTSVFTNITDKIVNINFGNNIALDNKFHREVDVRPNIENKIDVDKMMNYEVVSNNTDISPEITDTETWTKTIEEIKVNEESDLVHGEALDVNQDEYHDTSIGADNNTINHNLKENTTLPNVDEGTNMVSNNRILNEITSGETKTDEIKSNNMNTLLKNVEEVHDITVIERGDDTLSSEKAPKNNLIVVQCNEEIRDITVSKQADGYVLSEEALKINGIVPCIEEVPVVTVIDQAEDYVPSEEALKNNLIAQCNEELHDVIVTEQANDYVPSEEALKNNLIAQSNKELHDVIVTEQANDFVPTEEALKNNLIAQPNKELHDVIVTEQANDFVPTEEALKNNLIAQSNKELRDVIVTEQANDFVSTEEALKNNLIAQSNKELHDVIVTEQANDFVPTEEALKNNLIAQSNKELHDVIVTEQANDFVPTEEARKNNLIAQINEEVHDITVSKQADGYVLSEEALKINGIVPCNEEVHVITITEHADDYVPTEEALKNNIIVQSNKELHDVIVTEHANDYVPTEEALKNNLVAKYNEKVNNTTITNLADGYVSCEEALKTNGIIQFNEKVRNTTDTEQIESYVSSDEAPKSNHIVPSKTENIEESNNDKNIQHKKCNTVEENYIKGDLLGTNTVSCLKNKEELSSKNIEKFVVSNSSLANNDEHHHDNVTNNTQLNEEIKTNELSKEELNVEPFIKNCQHIDDSDVKKDYSQNNIDIEDYNNKDEYNNNNKQELETTDTNNANPMDLERAAITIQKVFRNFLFRSKTSSFDDSGKTEFNEFERDAETKNDDALANHNQNVSKDRRAVGINRMDTVLQTVNEEKSLSLSTDDSSTVSSAATVIQAHVRGFLVRNRLNRDKTISNTSLADCDHSDPPREGDSDMNKNKTVLNIHIVPEGGQFISRDESLLTSVELSLDGSPPTSANLHPLGYDKNERRKQLKREDAIQSISPPSNNSRLSEEHDSVKDVGNNDKKIQMEQTVSVKENVDSTINKVFSDDNIVSKEIEENSQNKNSESLEFKCKTSENSTDESDVITPFKPTEKKNSDTNNMKLLHSGEFHDVVLPTKVSRSDTEIVSDFSNVLVYFLVWNNS